MGIHRATVPTLVVLSGLLVGALALATTLTGVASACSCTGFTDDEAFAAADVVFSGTLLRTETPDRGPIWSSDDPEWFVFDVDTVYSGEAREVQAVETPRDGASCGLELTGAGPFLVYADLTDGVMSSSLCSGSRPLALGAPAAFGEGRPPKPGTSPPPPDSGAVDDAVASVTLLAAAGVVIVVAVGWRARRRAAGQVIDAA